MADFNVSFERSGTYFRRDQNQRVNSMGKNVKAFKLNATFSPPMAITAPPRAGPAIREKFVPTEFAEIAADSSPAGTSSRTDACQDGI